MTSTPTVTTNSSSSHDRASSMSSMLLDPLNQMENLAQTLFFSLSPAQAKPPAPRLEAFIECDKALADAVNLSYKHQIKQRKIERLKSEILELDTRWRQICIELEMEKRELETMIEEADERLDSIEQTRKASLPYSDLLAYAQSLSAFTSAPPNMPDLSLPGQPPPPLFFPPFPNEEKMRRGHLNAEAPLGPLGETHTVGKAPTVSPTQNLEPGVNPYRHDLRASGPTQFFDLDLDLNPDL
ncbi:hypothetical protein D9757_008094 [Collybiopsis confluens]|uniref:Mediator of RNA polymerase II transcription subunit 4 n=1 Tax=Collybiopsis confluens TaxID=2823264 RepID=A0A8H5M1U9_9AGAR|nr:hypothetical protein D9757_008094 [Collybiopsis confluens]